MIKDLQFGLTPTLTLYSGGLSSLASGDLPRAGDYSLSNDIRLSSIAPELSLGLLYKHKKLYSVMVAKGIARYYSFRGANASKTYLHLSPMVYWSGEYKSGYWTANALAAVLDDAPAETELTEGYIISGYNSLHKGLDYPSVQPSANADLALQYYHPIKQLLAELSFSVSNRKTPLPRRWLAEGFVFTGDGETFVSQSSFGPAFYFSKSIFSLDAKIESRVSLKHYDAIMMQNDVSYDYGGEIVDASLTLSISPMHWFHLQSKAEYRSSNVVMDNVPSTGSSFFHDSSDLIFRLSPRHSFTIAGVYYLNKSDSSSRLFLLGANFSWELSKSFRLFVTAANLLNATEYRNISVSPLMESAEYFSLRPRTVLIGIDWKR